MAAPTRPSPRATAYAYEDSKRVLVHLVPAVIYAYEDTKRVLTHLPAAGAYATERTGLIPNRPSARATAYAYEHSIPADPNELYVWDAALGQYVRVPWFVFNVDTQQWQQVL